MRNLLTNLLMRFEVILYGVRVVYRSSCGHNRRVGPEDSRGTLTKVWVHRKPRGGKYLPVFTFAKLHTINYKQVCNTSLLGVFGVFENVSFHFPC